MSVTDVGGAPAEIQVGNDVGYLLVVANNGPDIVSNVRLTDQLPQGVLVKEAMVAGSFFPPRPCPRDNHMVVCEVDAMAPGSTFTVGIIVTATTPGTLVNNGNREEQRARRESR